MSQEKVLHLQKKQTNGYPHGGGRSDSQNDKPNQHSMSAKSYKYESVIT